jgi:hypothetical protein
MLTSREAFDLDRALMASIKVNENGCWEWQGACDPDGYGAIKFKGKKHNTHKIAYEFYNSTTVEKGLDLDHLCRNRCCCNPDHLEPVTRSVNAKRGLVGHSKGAGDLQCATGKPAPNRESEDIMDRGEQIDLEDAIKELDNG